MNPNQTLVCTVIPRGLHIGGGPFPVSVLVSPRLSGAIRLRAFPDWLHWTATLKQRGLSFKIRCGNVEHATAIDTAPLRPDLWALLFNARTLVRPYEYTDYTQHGVITYPVRQALSALKAVYQDASLSLALPDPPDALQREKISNRRHLGSLLKGFDVHWDGREAPRLRARVRAHVHDQSAVGTAQAASLPLDREGLIPSVPNPDAFREVAMPFSVFHHMPMPPGAAEPDATDPAKTRIKPAPLALDADTVLDFHQVLSSLNTYPELLRALGLVFDLELPAGFVAPTTAGHYGLLAVTGNDFDWQLPLTQSAPLQTAYFNLQIGSSGLFGTAPRLLDSTLKTPPPAVIGLLDLSAEHFGLAQIDVDGGLHKLIMTAESLNPTDDPGLERNSDPNFRLDAAPNPEIFDPEATLPSLRSGGLSLWADRRGQGLLKALEDSKNLNTAFEQGQAQPRPLFAEDLVRGYRLDIWDSRSRAWHSLHERTGEYRFGDAAEGSPELDPAMLEDDTVDRQRPRSAVLHLGPDEGFVQLGAMQPAPGAQPAQKDLYLHEAIARWAGWSLSAPMPARHLGYRPRPDQPDAGELNPAIADETEENQPVTPFKLKTRFKVVPGSLPRLRFGTRYRVRARVVDLAANSLAVDDPLTAVLSPTTALPRDPEGFAYLRFEPVGAPLPVVRDSRALTDPGSAIDRIVIRSHNDAAVGGATAADTLAADTTAADRHLLPPRTAVEMAERHGLFDDAAGKLKADAAMWQLIAERDGPTSELQQSPKVLVAGQEKQFPLEPGERIETLPYLPDPLSRGAALRDLPGTPSGTVGHAVPDDAVPGSVHYHPLKDPNPRPGSATLIDFGAAFGNADWQTRQGFRLELAEPAAGRHEQAPRWDATTRVLTVYLAKGLTKVVSLSSYVNTDDLKLLGVWQWLREYVELNALFGAQRAQLQPGADVDRINHVLQRAVEGGHWMLTPPRLLTLVHAVQQPIGRPAFTALNVDHDAGNDGADALQTALVAGRTDATELAPIVAFRRLGATDAYLCGALQVHAASSAKIDIKADWRDSVDDLSQRKWSHVHHAAQVDELPLPNLRETYLVAPGADQRRVGCYDPEHDQIAFVRYGDVAGPDLENGASFYSDAAPRHLFNDTRHHRVRYSAVATSRYREYFPSLASNPGDPPLDFTRESEPVWVDVPASARPLAPDIAYVLPTFGWQRQTHTNIKRSVRFGGGLRVYLRRPWFSSGDGELLGVALWSSANGHSEPSLADREKFKPFITQWGMDPIWQTDGLYGLPRQDHFAGATAQADAVSLEERSAVVAGVPGRVNVVGYPVAFDGERGLWYADLTINTESHTYAPFVRLALTRFQPHALADARISRVVLAEFAQLTPDRSALVTSDPHHARSLNVVISGVAPLGPPAAAPGLHSVPPTQIRVRLQRRRGGLDSDLAWGDAPTLATVKVLYDGRVPTQVNLELWAGTVTFAQPIKPGEFRLLIEEFELYSADYQAGESGGKHVPGRLIYAEAVLLDDALISEN